MSRSLEKMEKVDSASDESSDSKTAKSDGLLSRGKDRRKSSKKMMLRKSPTKRRLSGGGDPEPLNTETTMEEEISSPINSSSAEGVSPPDTSPTSSTSHAGKQQISLISTGDPRADEMLECALHNLEEAGKALASLGENLEHELKLFLIELMGRTRKWASQVESKIEWTRRDILELNKELASRITALEDVRRESADLRNKLTQSEMSKSLTAENMRNGQSTMLDHTLGNTGGNQLSQIQSTQKIGGCDPKGQVSCSQSRVFGKDACHGEPVDAAAMQAEGERLQACCAELECEIEELRKENERIVKERAEYENAIQRALLKGVSSLNTEALKVLRCTPIPSCCPPPCPSTSIEPVSKSQRDCHSPNTPKSPKDCPGRSGARSCGNDSRESLNNGHGKRICPSGGNGSRSERKSKKSRDQNMLLLLHQKDAENFGIQGGSSPCESQAKKTNICGGGNCGKSGKYNYPC